MRFYDLCVCKFFVKKLTKICFGVIINLYADKNSAEIYGINVDHSSKRLTGSSLPDKIRSVYKWTTPVTADYPEYGSFSVRLCSRRRICGLVPEIFPTDTGS